MARVLVEIPRVGLVMETARLLRWLKDVGDTVAPGDPLAEIETEKAVVEIESAVTGKLVEILVQPETEVAVGASIAWVEDGKPETAAAVRAPAAAPQAAQSSAASKPAAAPSAGGRSSPAARRLAAERGIDLASVRGTGPGGAIQIEDVQREADAKQAPSAAAPAAAGSKVQLSPMRRAMARAVALSNATIPQFAVGRSVDWTEIIALRAKSASGASFNDFLLQAVARALIEIPAMNGIFVGDPSSPDAHIQPSRGAHIGLVVALADGMVVPVFHRADQLSLAQLAQRRAELVERARAGRLRQEDASGATLTISNLGVAGPDWFTAILNAPESAILAVGRTREVPVARGGAIAVRPISELTLTVDHRMIDGKLAADFLARVVQILEGGDWKTA
ncbi:MAG: 2-oxo acid dehydrogenase subunit E2 [Betaproteobacteria bacterium]|nr:2-oxo acid dehydrogenase subunit E2 [Betaproteobacteria bacterium]